MRQTHNKHIQQNVDFLLELEANECEHACHNGINVKRAKWSFDQLLSVRIKAQLILVN